MPKTDFHLTRATQSSSRRRQSARTTSPRGCSLACRARSSPSLTRSLSRAQWWMRLCPTRRSSSFLGGQPTFSCLRSESTSSDFSCPTSLFTLRVFFFPASSPIQSNDEARIRLRGKLLNGPGIHNYNHTIIHCKYRQHCQQRQRQW